MNSFHGDYDSDYYSPDQDYAPTQLIMLCPNCLRNGQQFEHNAEQLLHNGIDLQHTVEKMVKLNQENFDLRLHCYHLKEKLDRLGQSQSRSAELDSSQQAYWEEETGRLRQELRDQDGRLRQMAAERDSLQSDNSHLRDMLHKWEHQESPLTGDGLNQQYAPSSSTPWSKASQQGCRSGSGLTMTGCAVSDSNTANREGNLRETQATLRDNSCQTSPQLSDAATDADNCFNILLHLPNEPPLLTLADLGGAGDSPNNPITDSGTAGAAQTLRHLLSRILASQTALGAALNNSFSGCSLDDNGESGRRSEDNDSLLGDDHNETGESHLRRQVADIRLAAKLLCSQLAQLFGDARVRTPSETSSSSERHQDRNYPAANQSIPVKKADASAQTPAIERLEEVQQLVEELAKQRSIAEQLTDAVEARANVLARERAQSLARDLAKGLAREQAEILAVQRAEILARQWSESMANDRAEIIARGRAEVLAEAIVTDRAESIARRRAEVLARDRAETMARDRVAVLARSLTDTLAKEKADFMQRTEAMINQKANAMALKLAEDLAKERAEQLANEKAEIIARRIAEEIARERAEVLARERAEVLARERAEVLARERAEVLARERAEKIAKERAEEIAKERAEQIAKERAEQIAKERAEEIAKERAEVLARNRMESLAKELLASANLRAKSSPAPIVAASPLSNHNEAVATDAATSRAERQIRRLRTELDTWRGLAERWKLEAAQSDDARVVAQAQLDAMRTEKRHAATATAAAATATGNPKDNVRIENERLKAELLSATAEALSSREEVHRLQVKLTASSEQCDRLRHQLDGLNSNGQQLPASLLSSIEQLNHRLTSIAESLLLLVANRNCPANIEEQPRATSSPKPQQQQQHRLPLSCRPRHVSIDLLAACSARHSPLSPAISKDSGLSPSGLAGCDNAGIHGEDTSFSSSCSSSTSSSSSRSSGSYYFSLSPLPLLTQVSNGNRNNNKLVDNGICDELLTMTSALARLRVSLTAAVLDTDQLVKQLRQSDNNTRLNRICQFATKSTASQTVQQCPKTDPPTEKQLPKQQQQQRFARCQSREESYRLHCIGSLEDLELLKRQNRECCAELDSALLRIDNRLRHYASLPVLQRAQSADYNLLRSLRRELAAMQCYSEQRKRMLEKFSIRELPPVASNLTVPGSAR